VRGAHWWSHQAHHAMNNWKEKEAAVNADPVYIELQAVAKGLNERTTELKNELVRDTYKLQRLLILRDVALKHMYQLEDTTAETDNLLDELTANNGEAWCGMTSQAVEDLQEVLYDLCDKISECRAEHESLDHKRSKAWSVAHARAREVRTEFDANTTTTEI